MQKKWWGLFLGLGAVTVASATLTFKPYQTGEVFRREGVPQQGGDIIGDFLRNHVRHIGGDTIRQHPEPGSAPPRNGRWNIVDIFGYGDASDRGSRDETPPTLIAAIKDQAKSQKAADAEPDDWFDAKSREYTQTTRGLVANATENDRGLLIAGALFPAAGRLIRKPLDGRSPLSCSGVLISPRHFLTAAHCFCNKPEGTLFYRTAATCIAAGAPKVARNFVFLPAVGLFETSDDPKLLPEFHRVEDKHAVPNGQALGDIAIIELTADAPVRPAAIGGEMPKRMSVGFGRMSLSQKSFDELGIAEGVYDHGLGTIAFPKMLAQCTALYSDTLCAHYTDLDPRAIDTAVCAGDSGGPLLGIGAQGKISVFGVTSERRTAPGVASCDSNHEAQSVYTGLAKHMQWIAEVVGAAGASTNGSDPDCHEKLVTPLADETTGFSIRNTSSALVVASITSVALSNDNGGSFDAAPVITVSGVKDGSCRLVAGLVSVQSCRITRGEAIDIDIKGRGLIQAISCKFDR